MKTFFILMSVALMYANDDVLKEFSDGNRIFTSNIYKEMKKTYPGNFLVCPLSVETVLALVHAGARGTTAKQLSDGLQLPEDPERVQAIFKELSPKLNTNGKYTLASANKVYVKDGFNISDNFKSVAVNVFQSEIQNIDFTENEAVASEMNKWIEEKTYNKIKDVVNKDDLKEDTLTVLINALYFKGGWVKQFPKEVTRKQPFQLTSKNTAEVDMMELTEQFNYYEDTNLNAKWLEMLYVGNDISMTFVLPNEVDGLRALEESIERVLASPKYTKERVHVQLPKFTIESTIQFKEILENFGVKDLFDKKNSDLSGIGANEEPRVHISKIVQKAYIEVEERGTTAAAATVALGTNSYFDPKIKPYTFKADHPFIFVLKHSKAGILFMGRYTQPA